MKSLLLIWFALAVFAQAPRKAVLGTVTGFNAGSTEIVVKPENGEPQSVKFGPDTVVQKIAPGEKDLKKAETIEITAVAIGDRVLVSFAGTESEARRIVVMPASDIAKRNEADRQDWMKRGLSGVVASKKGNEITLRTRSFRGESTSTVVVKESTKYRRYAPDSVKFSDAQSSNLKDINVGDQLRARGEKNAEGNSVQADEVVFGTFLTRAGTITQVDAGAGELTAKELDGKKSFVVKITADSQVKKMASFGGMGGGRPMGGSGGAPGGTGGSGRPGGFGPPGGQGGPPDIAQMIERMPTTKLNELQAGDTIVVSSTKGVKSDQITAIMMLTNAGTLIQMAAAQQQQNASRGGPSLNGGGMGAGMGGGMSMGLGGIDLPGMVP